MSKFQQPTTKDGEAFPTTIQAPVAVRFEGVPPGTPLARELYGILQGEIGHFYLKNAQAYSLSPETHRRTRQQLPDATLEYTNNHGSETIRVRVSKALQAHAVKKAERPTPWDFALVELEVSGLTKTNAYFGAFLNGKIVPLAGVAEDYGNSGGYTYGTPPILQWGPSDRTIIDTISGVTNRIASLKVDLRPYHGLPVIKVDIHGYIKVFNDYGGDPTGSTWMCSLTREITSYSAGGYPILGGTFLHVNSPYTQADVLATFPELTGIPLEGGGTYAELNTFDATWNGSSWSPDDPNAAMAEWPSGLDTDYVTTNWGATPYWKKVERTGSSWWRSFTSNPTLAPQNAPPISSPANDGFGYRTFSYDLHHYYQPSYGLVPTYITRDAEVRSVFFRGDTLTVASDHYGTGKEWYIWEDARIYPDRPRMSVAKGKASMITMAVPGDTSPENKFGMPRLGTITLDIQHGVASWQAA